MKKKLAMALALTCAIAMTACGGSSAPAETAAPEPTVESTVDEPAPVEDLPGEQAPQPHGDLVIVVPVGDLFLEEIDHLADLEVGTAVLGALQR